LLGGSISGDLSGPVHAAVPQGLIAFGLGRLLDLSGDLLTNHRDDSGEDRAHHMLVERGRHERGAVGHGEQFSGHVFRTEGLRR
jgi:hypothetical protein